MQQPAPVPAPGVPRARWALLGLGVAQAVVALGTAVGGGRGLLLDEAGANDPLIIPATYTYAIWGVIAIATLVYAVAQLRLPPAAQEPAGLLAVVCLGFCASVGVTVLGLLPLTVVAFAVMLTLLLRAARRATPAHLPDWPERVRVLLTVTLGIYAGWLSVLVWVTLGSAVADLGLDVRRQSARLGDVLLVVAVTVTLVTVLYRVSRQRPWLLAFTAAAGWTLVGVIVAGLLRDAELLALFTGMSGLFLGVATLRSLRVPTTL